MTIIQAIISGLIQGVTEFFPISSDGHLVIFQGLIGLKEPQLAFDIFLHLGTLIAILIFFRRDIISLFGKDRKMLKYIAAASVPTFLIALVFENAVEQTFGSPRFASLMLIITGAWLIVGDLIPRYVIKNDGTRAIGFLNSIMIGISQGIAILPGISRSGSTIATAMILGIDRERAFRFSFLLAIPAIGGAVLFKGREIGSGLLGHESIFFLAGGFTAMIVGLVAIKALLGMIRKNLLFLFGIYCIIAGSSFLVLYHG